MNETNAKSDAEDFFPPSLFPICYSTMQHEGFRFSNVRSAARVAASKTSSTPSPVKDEHSRYFRAPIVAPVSPPSLGVTNRCDFFLISSIASGSSRRSFFSPTKIMGTPGHRSFDSSTHYTIVSSIRFVPCLNPSSKCKTNLVFHVLQAIGGVDGEPNQDDMGLGICHGSQSLVVFLACSIPES